MESKAKAILIAVTAAVGIIFSLLLDTCDDRLARQIQTTDPHKDSGAVANPKKAHSKIVVLSPAAVEIVWAVGAGDRVIGTTRYATYPPKAKQLPNLGGIMDIDYELLSTLAPDLIIAQNSPKQLTDYAAGRAIDLLDLEIESIEDVLQTCKEIGRYLGLSGQGQALADKIKTELDDIQTSIGSASPTPCFISIDRPPGQMTGLLSTGRDTFLTKLVEMAGGKNIFDDVKQNYPTISKEALLARAPHVILEFKPGAGKNISDTENQLKDWQALKNIPAVDNKRIFIIGHDDALLPGPRMAAVARQISNAINDSSHQKHER